MSGTQIGETVQRARKAVKYTQKELADHLGITTVHLSNIENGKAFPSPSLLVGLREFFGVDIYILAWCRYGNHEQLPESSRTVLGKLERVWMKRIKEEVGSWEKA